MNRRVVVGDVGGTHARWAVYDGILGPVSVQQTRETTSLEESLERYLADHTFEPDAVCVGVAGPVVDGRAALTNVEWMASEEKVRWPTKLLNDLEAVAYAVPVLKTMDLTALHGSAAAGNYLVVGVGTGFGGALVQDGQVHAMEPGHDPLEAFDVESEALIAQLKAVVDIPTIEDVVSGRGLELILQMKKLGVEGVPAGRVVSEGWRQCDELAWVRRNFLRCFGFSLGRLIQRNHALGGVFVAGGVVGHWLDDLSSELFLSSYSASVASMNGDVEPPIQVIKHPHAALLGAGIMGQGLFAQ